MTDLLSINPAMEVLRYHETSSSYLEEKARRLLKKMEETSELYKSVNALSTELKIRTGFDQSGIAFIDFTGSEFQEIIDRLHETKILEGQPVYKLETKKDIEIFKARLEGKENMLKNQNQEPLILLQPILNLIDQMNKIAKACLDSEDRLKGRINSNCK